MFTGERPIRDCLPNSGQQYRVIELNDVIPELNTKEIDNVKRVIENNYGHIIELFVQEIFNTDVQKLYDECFDLLPETQSNIEGRSKSIFACIMVAGTLLERIFKGIGIPERNSVEIVNKYFKECIQDNPIELEWIRALRVINDWTVTEARKFELEDNFYFDPKYGLLGKITVEFLDIIGTEFTKKMKECGFSPTAIKQALCKDGIIECGSRKDGNYTVTVNKEKMAGVRIKRSAMKEALQLKEEYDRTAEVLETVKMLSRINGVAELDVIQQIFGESVKEHLSKLMNEGKIIQLGVSEYM
jgi:putative DNA primase/helicase